MRALATGSPSTGKPGASSRRGAHGPAARGRCRSIWNPASLLLSMSASWRADKIGHVSFPSPWQTRHKLSTAQQTRHRGRRNVGRGNHTREADTGLRAHPPRGHERVASACRASQLARHRRKSFSRADGVGGLCRHFTRRPPSGRQRNSWKQNSRARCTHWRCKRTHQAKPPTSGKRPHTNKIGSRGGKYKIAAKRSAGPVTVRAAEPA